ncbi:hypothetical protein ACFLSJ_05575 [Verrucomicrobiota bacterium]
MDKPRAWASPYAWHGAPCGVERALKAFCLTKLGWAEWRHAFPTSAIREHSPTPPWDFKRDSKPSVEV